jgi:predicted unusual protein kinase regulating ubiquinone biosynthesis (AarF/ABC1/UbiB family)
MSDDAGQLPSGRFARFARLAGLAGRGAGDLALGKAKRLFGGSSATDEVRAARRVLETLGEMKGAAMKLGQQLAMEADALPAEARDLVSKLYAGAPPMRFETVREVVEDELGESLEAAFRRFEPAPLASASLGQVHRATLHDGTEVAVKVQYPGVADAVESDLKNIAVLMKALPNATFKGLDTARYVEEVRREVGAETDYRGEAERSAAYAAALAPFGDLHVPRVIARHSTMRLLTMEFVEGRPLNVFAASQADDEARWRVGRQLALALLGPFVRDGLIHADPHPGNFLVRPDGRLTVLDFGAVKRLSPTFVEGFWGLLMAECRGGKPDFVAQMSLAGYVFTGDVVKATRHLSEIHEVASRPVQTETYDWGACTMVPDLRQRFVGDFRDLVEIQPPPEGLMFFRAIGGLANNMRLLRASGSYRALCLELDALRTVPAVR